MQAALPRLQERHRQLLAGEEEARRAAVYAEVLVERDALAAELAKVYPVIAKQLVDLLKRLRTCDQRVEQTNSALPLGCPPLLLAELVARGPEGFARAYGTDIPRFGQAVRLPAFDGRGVIWPPPSVSDLDPANLLFHCIAQAQAAAAEARAPFARRLAAARTRPWSLSHFRPRSRPL